MKRSKPGAKYRGMSLPVPLIEEVKEHIQNKPEYRSVSEFVKGAIRRQLLEERTGYSDNMIIPGIPGKGKSEILNSQIKKYIQELVKKEVEKYK